LSFAPGEAYQFDWSHEVVVMSGVTTTLKVAHVRLCHSRMMFVRAYPRETQEMVFDARDQAFAFFKGACARGVYDNMKTAVETIFVGRDRQYNRRFFRCARIISSIQSPAHRRPAGRRGRLRTRSASSASASSRRGCGSKPTMS
jgi:transposase